MVRSNETIIGSQYRCSCHLGDVGLHPSFNPYTETYPDIIRRILMWRWFPLLVGESDEFSIHLLSENLSDQRQRFKLMVESSTELS
jgi:hypothetical protein